jgi:hypothetical protein
MGSSDSKVVDLDGLLRGEEEQIKEVHNGFEKYGFVVVKLNPDTVVRTLRETTALFISLH